MVPALLVLVAGCAGPQARHWEAAIEREVERDPRPLEAMEPELRMLVLRGQDLWRQPPDPENTVACATCHFAAGEIRGWAASFPKVKPMPPPFARVMTLQQAVSEAVARHYRIPHGARNRQAAREIVAYLAWLGEGRIATPGVAAGQPRFPDRLTALRASMARGEDRVRQTCGPCHGDDRRFAGVAATFPRAPRGGGAVTTLEEFLESHAGLPWDGSDAADVAAFLAMGAAGRFLEPGGP
jgi:cytochrome c